MNKKLIRQIKRFLISGSISAVFDVGIYFIMLNYLTPFYSKAISFSCATIVSFLLNKLWTFEAKKFLVSEIVKYISFYIVSTYLNALVNDISINLFGNKVLAFLIATGFSMVFNFIGLKYFCFIKKN